MKKRIKKYIKKFMPQFYQYMATLKRTIILIKFKRDYPSTIIFMPTSENRKLYSQDNQDYIIYNHFFKGKKDGFFCDIGGNHPLKINNTRYFEEIGWTGIAFEPLPHMAQLWKKYRKAKLFSIALSDQHGFVILTKVKNTTGWEDMLSFIKNTRDVKYEYDTADIKVPAERLQDILKREKIQHIDFLSLDVEGHELNVLKGIDFSQVKIEVLTIENNSPCCPWYGDSRIRELMFKNDYILWARIFGLDDIYT